MSTQSVTIRGEGVGDDLGAPKGSETKDGTRGASTRTATATPTGDAGDQTPEQKAAAEKAAADKAAAEKAEDKAEGERPFWLPEKFKTPEDLAKAYAESEKKISELAGGKGEDKGGGGKTGEAGKDEEDKSFEAKLTGKKLDFGEFEKEFSKEGKITDAMYEKTDDAGIPRVVVDAYFEGRLAVAEKMRVAVTEVLGGPENLKKVLAWGNANLSEEEQTAYNELVDSGKPALIQLALTGLYAKYQEVTGAEPDRVSGEAGGRGEAGPKPFGSTAEVTEAMKDPRYRKDPAYRKQIERRLAVTP